MVVASYFVAGDTLLRRGGGEPSLASREDPYGSLRMPLSICVILRIYNEDAIYTFLSRSSRHARRSLLLTLASFAPASLSIPHRFFLTLFISLALRAEHADTFVIIAIASIGQSANELMSHGGNYCRATQDDVRSFVKRVTTATGIPYHFVIMNLHTRARLTHILKHNNKNVRKMHFSSFYCIFQLMKRR